MYGGVGQYDGRDFGRVGGATRQPQARRRGQQHAVAREASPHEQRIGGRIDPDGDVEAVFDQVDAPILRAALEGTGVPLLDAASMDEAVLLAARRARPGDAVLLSPACASFDMFRDYAHRAEVFRGAVQALADDPAPMREGAAAPVEGEDAT